MLVLPVITTWKVTNSLLAGLLGSNSVKKPPLGTKPWLTTLEAAACAGIDDNTATARPITISLVLPNCFIFFPSFRLVACIVFSPLLGGRSARRYRGRRNRPT